jgi:hypothetical protein
MESALPARPMKRVEILPATDGPAKRRIAPWKFVGGALIHLSVPAYLLTLLATFILHVLEYGTAAGTLSLMPRVSLWFVIVYAGVTVAGTGLAGLIGAIGRVRRKRWLKALGKNPPIQSEQQLSHAIGMLAAMTRDPAVVSALPAVADAAWRHDDERYQQVSRDLEKAAGAYFTAHASAHGEQRLEIDRLAAETLRHVAQRLDDLASDTGAAAAQKAQTMAGYIASKYGDGLDSVR